MNKKLLLTVLLGAGFAGSAQAAEIVVDADIATSTTWTKNNTYNLAKQIYVLPGASLTIEAGTVIASSPTPNGSGSLAITAGAQIFVLGTEAEPVIFTSTTDVNTWINGNPKTGTYRQAANEWGNLTIMGRGYVSEDATPGNTAFPNPANVATMEGLTAQFPGDTRVIYGGGDDDDDSGTIRYTSIRYAGRVVGLGNELNGLSLGGIGRGTDIEYVEIMNNVDDGIEIWGGTVNVKHFAIWNVGDDSFDLDQGWRGKAQFGLIVQGYSVPASQGSGVGDNAIEVDGAENSDYQPVTTVSLYNMTLIGQPISGDHGVAYRDGARVQLRNSIIMDMGERVVRLDNVDGDGGQGYGHNGTLTWAQTWTTPFNAVPAHPNDAAPGLAGWAGYPAQVDGFLNEISDTVFFNNNNANAYTDANAVNVFAASNNNLIATQSPVRYVGRGPAVNPFGSLVMLPVKKIDPRGANDALVSVGQAPGDGFFTPAPYRGAFDGTTNWLKGWSAADAYGFFTADASVQIRTSPLNVPNSIAAVGLPTFGNSSFAVQVNDPALACVTPGQLALLIADFGGPLNLPFPGFGCGGGFGALLIAPTALQLTLTPQLFAGAPVNFGLPIPSNIPSLSGLEVNTQGVFVNLSTFTSTFTSALDFTFGT